MREGEGCETKTMEQFSEQINKLLFLFGLQAKLEIKFVELLAYNVFRSRLVKSWSSTAFCDI